MEILSKNFVVYGTGSSGKSAVSFLFSRGAKTVYLYDDNKVNKVKDAVVIENFEDIKNLDISCVILSPGVQVINNPNIEYLNKLKIPYISEFGLGFEFVEGKTICVTGTNGKTTTVNLIYEMLKTTFKDVFLCGNTKIPITQIANNTTNKSIVVCEVSSFALETCNIHPDICTILNITQDHISRHKTFENYKNTKLKILKNLDENNYFICNSNFEIKTNAKILNYNINKKGDYAFSYGKYIYFKNKKIINKKYIKLLGQKNIENILTAINIAKIFKIKNSKIKKVLKNFVGLDHRLQIVKIQNSITFVDDSKATNVDSTICAIQSFDNSIILLLGGSDKGYDFDDIFMHTNNIKKIVAFGQTSQKIYQCAKRHQFEDIITFATMKQAVLYTIKIARSDDVVLLSPACASFDEFNSYAHRGEVFCKLVNGEYEEV